MGRNAGNAPGRQGAGAARGTILLVLVVFALVAGATFVHAEPLGEPEASFVYERPEPGVRRGLLSAPAEVVYGAAALALVASASYLVARSRRRP